MSSRLQIDWESVRAALGATRALLTQAAEPSAEESQRILAERAEALAGRVESERSGGGLDLLLFALGGERYAIERKWVYEVQRLEALTRLPKTPAFVVGITHHRGQLLQVVDVRGLLGVEVRGLSDAQARYMVVGAEGPEFALLLHDVPVTARLERGRLGAAPGWLSSGADLVRGLTDDGVLVFEGGALIETPRLFLGRNNG